MTENEGPIRKILNDTLLGANAPPSRLGILIMLSGLAIGQIGSFFVGVNYSSQDIPRDTFYGEGKIYQACTKATFGFAYEKGYDLGYKTRLEK